jgi:protein TonB
MPFKMPSSANSPRLTAERILAELHGLRAEGRLQGMLALLKSNRFTRPFLVASVLVFALYWLLYALIATTSRVDGSETIPTVDFVRVVKNFELETRERKPPELPEKPETPPEVPIQQAQIEKPTGTNLDINMTLENSTQVKSKFGLSANEGEYLPLVKVAPLYPPRAQSQGIEGWVLLEFTVTQSGTVADPVVLDAQPKGVFEEAAKRAVLKFKYKPRVENGRPIAVQGVQHVIRFEIDKNRKSG